MAKALKIQTDWVKVASEGNTIDGRKVEAKDIQDMADTYSKDRYEANIWREHERYFDSHGEVVELKAEKDEQGRLSLYAKLNPNAYCLNLIQRGLANYFSIEINRKFMDDARAYMTGLGIVREPAAQGMEAVQLYKKSIGVENEYTEAVEVDSAFKSLFSNQNNNNTAENSADEMTRFFSMFKKLFSTNTQTEAEDAMTPEEKKALEDRFKKIEDANEANSEKLEGIEKSLGGLSEQFKKLGKPEGAEGEPGDGEGEGEGEGGDNEAPSKEAFAKLQQDFADLQEQFKKAVKNPSGNTEVDDDDIASENKKSRL